MWEIWLSFIYTLYLHFNFQVSSAMQRVLSGSIVWCNPLNSLKLLKTSSRCLQLQIEYGVSNICPFNLHPEKWFSGATWDFLGHELEKYRVATTQIFFSGQAPNFFSDLPYETQLFLRLPRWNNSGWILPYFFQGGKSTHLFKSKNRVQIKRAIFSMSYCQNKYAIFPLYVYNKLVFEK